MSNTHSRAVPLASSTPRWSHATRLSPLYHHHLALSARMAAVDGWIMPAAYTDSAEEDRTLHTAVGLLDTSDVGKISLKGQGIESFLHSALSTGEASIVGKSSVGSRGETVYRLAADEALATVPSATTAETVRVLSDAAGDHDDMHVLDLSGAFCALRLIGPQAPAVLERVSPLDLAPDRFADGTVTQGSVARIHALVARHDAGHLLAYNLVVDRDLGAYLWDTLLDQGAPLGLQPVGREAAEGLD